MRKKPAAIPFNFLLDRLESLSPKTKPMFGCHAVYVGEKIVLIMRQKGDERHDNGVWLATAEEHHSSLKRVFPSMRPIRLFGGSSSSWQNIPVEADDFEESVMTACDMILKNDPRIGKIPVSKKKKSVRKR